MVDLNFTNYRLSVVPMAENAFRLQYRSRYVQNDARDEPDGFLFRSFEVPGDIASRITITENEREVRISAPGGSVRIDRKDGSPVLVAADGTILAREIPDRRRVPQDGRRHDGGTGRSNPSAVSPDREGVAAAGFAGWPDERLFGTGQFQDGHFALNDVPRRLTQVNSQISIPVVISSRGYGIFWHNYGLTELNPTETAVELVRRSVDASGSVVEVTSAEGTVREARRTGEFSATFSVPAAGRYACMLDVGAKMARRWNVSIDGIEVVDQTNYWLPPTTSWHSQLAAGEHTVTVVGEWQDRPVISFRHSSDDLVLSSPEARALDYILIAGNVDGIIATLRTLTGQVPLFPVWAYGYIHCRERFHSQQELLETAAEFRRREIPADVIVQDWQYWGRHGWNAMRFDEKDYPDPAGMVRELHARSLRLMLSVWSKVDRSSEVGTDLAANDCYISGTDWIDFFNPDAAARYWDHFRRNLIPYGVDAWWLDATEPENDDLDGRQTAVGTGGRVRNAYPLFVTRTVYEGLRRGAPDRRVMILTRCAFPGVQRYAAATWSGDIGADWVALRLQVPAGLNYVVTGLPYWTTDCGGFFRPGDRQYSDPAYHELFVRWFQFAIFCPLLRVHGYQTDTEPWNYGPAVEREVRRYLDLRYRLLPYIYSTAAAVTFEGSTMMRPLVMDFPFDSRALDQKLAYMFGPSLLVRPVTAPGVQTQSVYLPRGPREGGGWYDFWSGELSNGGVEIEAHAPLETIPLFVPAGSIIPLSPKSQYSGVSVGEQAAGELEVRIYPGSDGEFVLYDDDGKSYGYEKGAFERIRFTWDNSASTATIHRRIGGFDGMRAERVIRFVKVRAGHGTGIAETQSPDAEVRYRGEELRIRV